MDNVTETGFSYVVVKLEQNFKLLIRFHKYKQNYKNVSSQHDCNKRIILFKEDIPLTQFDFYDMAFPRWLHPVNRCKSLHMSDKIIFHCVG